MQIKAGMILTLCVATLGGWLAVPARATEAPPPEPVPAEEAQAQEAAPSGAEEDESAGDSVGGQMGEVSLDRFIPTEEISADGAVSFPVDI